jgi:hypothetical protein
MDCSMSERAITRSPDWIMPLALSREKVRFRLLSMSSEKARRKGIRPHCRFSRLLTDVDVVKAKTGQSGRHRESREAMCPVLVNTKTASTPKPLAADKKNYIVLSVNKVIGTCDNRKMSWQQGTHFSR